jgi:hypothetical protein
MSGAVMTLRRSAFLCILLSLSCGDSGPGGPLSGTWNFVTNLTGTGNRACTTSNFTLQLQHSGASLFGTYYGQLSCTESGSPILSALVTGDIANGSAASGGAVSFYFDDQSVSFVGALGAADSMGGTANWWVNVGPPTGTLAFSGTWAATR